MNDMTIQPDRMSENPEGPNIGNAADIDDTVRH
jgi:hypothetical protein